MPSLHFLSAALENNSIQEGGFYLYLVPWFFASGGQETSQVSLDPVWPAGLGFLDPIKQCVTVLGQVNPKGTVQTD